MLGLPLAARSAESYRIERLATDIHVAIANGAAATSNGFFVEGDTFVVAGGAHMTKEAITDLFAAIGRTTPKPVRYFILPHHHPGFSHIDFDFPPGVELVMTAPTWQSLSGEVRKTGNPVLFFSEGLTLKAGRLTIVLTNLGPGHSRGDLTVYIPEAKILFASDLLYVGSVGYMGEGYLRNWVEALDFLAELETSRIVPGYGPVCTVTELDEFRTYFRDFLTAVLAYVEQGESLEGTVKNLVLPKYARYDGYDRFFKTNVERAYRELKGAPQ
jgi:glyoxylase-like metal-dependent hydrolase (beta-lactamase superfamily II)